MLVLVREDLAPRDRGCRSWPRCWATASPPTATTRPRRTRRARARRGRSARPRRGGRRRPRRSRYVNSHGTGTAKNDPAETRATRLGLGRRRGQVGGEQHQVDDRPPARRGRARSRRSSPSRRCRSRSRRRPRLRGAATRSATWTTCPTPPARMTIDVAVSNNFAFGGANASPGARAGRARCRGARSRRSRPRRGHRARDADLRRAAIPTTLWEAFADERDCARGRERRARRPRPRSIPSP